MTRLRPLVLLFGLVFSVLGLSSSRAPMVGDAKLMCASAESLWREGTFAVSRVRSDVVTGPDGKLYVKYPLLAVLQCVPATLLGELARKLAPGDAAFAALAPGLVPHAVTATLAVGAALLGLELGASLTAAVALGLIVVFATPIWVSGRSLDSEPLQAALTIWIVLFAVRARDENRRGAFFSVGLLCGLALNTKITLVILPVAVLIDQLHEPLTRVRAKSALLYALPGALIGVFAFLAYNHVRFGELLEQGYSARRDGKLGFSVPLLSGLHGLLFSSGKSVFQYAPVLLACVWAVPGWFRERRRDLWLVAIPCVFTLLVISKWWAWHGDWGWGSRLLLPALPLACVLALRYLSRPSRRTRSVLGLLVAAGCYVQLLAVSVDPADYLNVVKYPGRVSMGKHPDAPEVRDPLLLAHFIPEFNPIVSQQWLLVRYFNPEPFTIDTWHPWQSLGVRSWRPRSDPTPERLAYWVDRDASRAAWLVQATLALLSALFAVLLARQLRADRTGASS
jgi:hypothetical protein